MSANLSRAEIVKKFIKVSEASGTKIEIVNNNVNDIDEAIRRAVANDESVINSGVESLSNELQKIIEKNSTYNNSLNGKIISDTFTGITGCFAGVARTGSVCIAIDNSFGAATSLFTRKHICILEAEKIVERPRDIFELEDPEIPSTIKDFVFISGPSATADMGELVRGVHGPGEFHIILIK